MLAEWLKKQKKRLIAGSILAGVLLAGFVGNTVIVYQKLNATEREDVLDGNHKLANNIEEHLTFNSVFIKDLADALSRMPEHLSTESLFRRKAQAGDFEKVFMVTEEEWNKEGGLAEDDLDVRTEDLSEDIWEKPAVFVLDNQSFVFSAPVFKGEKAEKMVLGIESYESVLASYQQEVKWKQGLQLLVDKTTGQILMMADDESEEVSKSEIKALQEKLKKENYKDNIYENGRIISVVPIEGTDWVQVFTKKNKVITEIFSRNISIYFLLTIAEAILLTLFFYMGRKETKKREELFLTDLITGGYNREGFLRLGHEYVRQYGKDAYTVVCLNICEFRRINELWGENTGNDLLRFVYRILSKNMDEKELVCRSNVDNFLLLLQENQKERISERITEHIQDMNQIINQKHEGYNLGFFIGACQLSLEEDIVTAISNGIYVSKQKHEKDVCVFFDKEISKKIAEEYELNELFEESVKNHDFQIYFQPKMSKRGEVKAEALVRWVHPEKGVIAPDRFIPLFENNGKICKLDFYVFEEVCRILSERIREGKDIIEISVNLSRVTLRQVGESIGEKYKAMKDKYHIPDGALEIEMTETALLDRNQITFIQQILKRLRACGLNVALDDFGFAYSSLSILKSFEVDTIKLDRSFFIDETAKSKRIVENIIRLAHSLDICVVAEGIEDFGQVEELWGYGCDFIQGYVYSKPVPLELFEKWRDEHGKQEY